MVIIIRPALYIMRLENKLLLLIIGKLVKKMKKVQWLECYLSIFESHGIEVRNTGIVEESKFDLLLVLENIQNCWCIWLLHVESNLERIPRKLLK